MSSQRGVQLSRGTDLPLSFTRLARGTSSAVHARDRPTSLIWIEPPSLPDFTIRTNLLVYAT